LNTFNGELAVTERQVNRATAAAKQQLAPCLAAVKNYSVPQGAAQALDNELGDQYVGIALRRVIELVIAADTRTEQLPIGGKLEAALQTEVTQSTALFQLNTCTDFAAWKAAGFAPSSEPSGTQFATAFDNTPSVDTEGTLYHMLSTRQRRTINPIRKKADAHMQALAGTVAADLLVWLA
jgi:hypothetical protein